MKALIKRILLYTAGLVVIVATTAFILMSQKDKAFGNGLKTGDNAPAFSGNDQQGNPVALSSLMKKGSVVLIFYRGYWCPFCNKHLSELQDSLQLILDKGASVIAVSPELPEYREKTVSKTGANFILISDTTHQIMRNYKVDYTMGKGKAFMYKAFGMNIEKTNGDDTNTLPVPATYIIGTDGKIKYVHFDPDYKNRASVDEIVKQL